MISAAKRKAEGSPDSESEAKRVKASESPALTPPPVDPSASHESGEPIELDSHSDPIEQEAPRAVPFPEKVWYYQSILS